MKVFLLMLVFTSCTLFGVWLDEDQRKRLKEIGQFIYLFELLKGEIDYQLTPLQEACRQISSHEKGVVCKVFEGFAKHLEAKETKGLYAMWQESLKEQQAGLHLKEEDYSLLKAFGSSCGYLDKNMQTRNLDMVLEKLRHQQGLLEAHYEKCTKLNRSLGMLIGGALVIFLI